MKAIIGIILYLHGGSPVQPQNKIHEQEYGDCQVKASIHGYTPERGMSKRINYIRECIFAHDGYLVTEII